MAEAQSTSVKYVFLDVVGYSVGRSVEAQTDIISFLNNFVKESVLQLNLADTQVIYLPTGDGMCIALMGAESPYDVHILLSLEILKKLEVHNQSTTDDMRRFKIRVGVNTNVDNIVTDINGQRNVSGAGVNTAQRVMNKADGNQVLVGEGVYETLRHREKYMSAFKSFTTTVKHGIELRIHQLVKASPGLDTLTPSEFKKVAAAEQRLTKLVAYYFSHAVKNREFIRSSLVGLADPKGPYAWITLLYMLARDSAEASSASELSPHHPHTWGAGKAQLSEQFDHYNSIDFHVMWDFGALIYSSYLSKFSQFFESSAWGLFDCIFINKSGREKLRTEAPAIWKEFGFLTTE